MTDPNDDYLTPKDMRDWLFQEIKELTHAMELRVQDATEFVTAYALGEISGEEATKRLLKYQQLWGDSPTPNALAGDTMKSDHIKTLLRRDLRSHRPDRA